jgi:hypothetical protein
MWLQILQSCKHERDAFFAGEIRYVSGASADVLIAMGWGRAVAEPSEAARIGALDPASVTLQIHPGTLGVADTLKGT